MAKNTRGVKEFTREQRLVKENQALKRENSRLRKELNRLDINREDQVKQAVEESFKDSAPEDGQVILDRLKQEWKCNEPNCAGFLEIIKYNKVDSTWYYRDCSVPDCSNRTKGQRWTSDVRGILRREKP